MPRPRLPITPFLVAVALAASGDEPPVREPDRLVSVTLTDYRIAPLRVEAPRGRLTIRVANRGRLPHNLEIRGPGGRVRGRISTLLPGETGSFKVRLRRGDWVMRCAIANHEELGQHAELVTR